MRPSNKLFVVTREAALAAPQKTKASLTGSSKGGPVVPLWKPRTNGRPNDKRDCRVRDPCALAGPGTHFSSPLKVAVAFEGSPRLQARPRRHRLEAQGFCYRSGRCPDWLKMKNPTAPAVKREAEEDWGRGSVRSMCATKKRNLAADATLSSLST
jgi:hypothetical protein